MRTVENPHLEMARRVAADGSFVDTIPWMSRNATKTIGHQVVESPVIVVGQILTNRPRVTADGRGIDTVHEVVVLDVLKGEIYQGSTLSVAVPGGRLEFDDGAFARSELVGTTPPEPHKRYAWFLESASHSYVTGDDEELYEPAGGPLGIWELEGGSGFVSPIGALRSPLSLEILGQRIMANEFIRMIRGLAATLPTLVDVAAGPDGQRVPLTARQMSASRALRVLGRGASQSYKPGSLLDAPGDLSVGFHMGVQTHRTTPGSVEEQVRRGVCQADAVVIGTLTAWESFLTDDELYVLTEYDLHVTESLAGAIVPGADVSYVRPGGAVNIRGQIIRVTSRRWPELALGVPYILSLWKLPGEANSFVVTTGERARWVADAIEIGDLAVGRSAWSLKELKDGVAITRVLNAIDPGACQ